MSLLNILCCLMLQKLCGEFTHTIPHPYPTPSRFVSSWLSNLQNHLLQFRLTWRSRSVAQVSGPSGSGPGEVWKQSPWSPKRSPGVYVPKPEPQILFLNTYVYIYIYQDLPTGGLRTLLNLQDAICRHLLEGPGIYT